MMGDSVFSKYWYRIADLKPKLRDATVVSRHLYRGTPWYVLKNSLDGRSHRFNAAAYALIGRLDGCCTVQQIWDDANRPSAEFPPTQDEIIRLLGRLHDADLIQSDILPSTVELIRKVRQTTGGDWKKSISNPFSIRFPLWDPDRFLEKFSFLAAPFFSRGAFVIWLLIIVCALVAAFLNWPELTNRISDRLLSPKNLLLIWLTYPLVKILHEAGHAFAIKKWGGEVHEMGIILLALTPIPYVDASASASFPDKQQRISVAAMGMAVELLMASVALFVWINVQPGIVKSMAYNVMLIGGVSTVLFNGNPLLRYDGYYMLADLIEIPNLGRRATRYLSYLLQRYLLRIETAESPVTASGEKIWFILYGPVAFCYRMVVLVGLVFLVSSRFLVVGVLIAIWGVVSLLIRPAVHNLTQFLKSPGARRKRPRLLAVAGVGFAVIIFSVFILPVPLWTTAQGVVWLPKQSMVKAGAGCEVVEVLASEGQLVAENAPLIKGRDPFLDAQIEIHQAQLDELYAEYNAQPLHERVKRKQLLEEISRVKGDLRQAGDNREKLLVRSPARGKFILIEARNLPGRFVQKGELLGYILAEHRPTVRAVVHQTDIGLVRKRLKGVQVRLAEQIGTVLQADLKRIIPAADSNLPAVALGTSGGGNIPVDPSDPEGLRALESLFQLDIGLPQQVEDPHIGGRVYIRLEYGTMTLAHQWYRRLRQLFLRKFYV
jgi:putative peptide zinc metalloprotease protein